MTCLVFRPEVGAHVLDPMDRLVLATTIVVDMYSLANDVFTYFATFRLFWTLMKNLP